MCTTLSNCQYPLYLLIWYVVQAGISNPPWSRVLYMRGLLQPTISSFDTLFWLFYPTLQERQKMYVFGWSDQKRRWVILGHTWFCSITIWENPAEHPEVRQDKLTQGVQLFGGFLNNPNYHLFWSIIQGVVTDHNRAKPPGNWTWLTCWAYLAQFEHIFLVSSVAEVNRCTWWKWYHTWSNLSTFS